MAFEPFEESKDKPPLKVRWLNRDWIPASWRGDSVRVISVRLLYFLFVLFLLGAIPWLRSPIDHSARVEALIVTHDGHMSKIGELQLQAIQTMCIYSVPAEARYKCLGARSSAGAPQ